MDETKDWQSEKQSLGVDMHAQVCACVCTQHSVCTAVLWHQRCLLCSPGGTSATHPWWVLCRHRTALRAPQWCDWREQRGVYAQWTGDDSMPTLVDNTVHYWMALQMAVITEMRILLSTSDTNLKWMWIDANIEGFSGRAIINHLQP